MPSNDARLVSAASSMVLVTGGTGLVGRSIVRRLLAAGRSVRIISRGGRHASLPGLTVWQGDFTCRRDLAAAMQGCDAIFHCAAEKRDPSSMAAINVAATKLLLDMACEQQIRFFCHLSSVAVFGKVRANIVDEDARCEPVDSYAVTKLAAERIVQQGLPSGSVVILRPTNIFDAETLAMWLQDSMRKRIRRALTARENSHLVYVEDVAAAAIYALESSNGRHVDVYIVSSDQEPESTNRQVQAALAGMVGTASPPIGLSAPLWLVHGARLIRNRNSNAGGVIYSSRKLLATGFRMPYGLREGLSHAVSLWRSGAASL
jgi:nucleoside-diphosphate-sugar epimerase